MIILVKIAENRKTAPKTPLIAQEITDQIEGINNVQSFCSITWGHDPGLSAKKTVN